MSGTRDGQWPLPDARGDEHRTADTSRIEAIRRSRTIHGFYSAAAVQQRRTARQVYREFRRLLAILD
jgi:hypothetical protein